MRWLHQRLGSCLSVFAAVLVAVAVVQSIPSAAADDLPSSSRVSGAGQRAVLPAEGNQAAKPAENPKAPCDPGAGDDDGAKLPPVPPRPKDAVVAAVIKVQKRHEKQLLGIEGVVGVATGVAKNGDVVVKVYTDFGKVGPVPARLERVGVEVVKSGRFRALQRAVPRPRPRSSVPSTHDFHRRPVPIGVSVGADIPGRFGYGTLGCRVKDRQGNVYALSNNHVFADNGAVPIGTAILQPGTFDPRTDATGVRYGEPQVIGYLEKFIRFRLNDAAEANPNRVDAAIASCTTATVGNTTPPDGYGWYFSKPVKAYLGQRVQKYGARTGYTKGGVVEVIKATFDIDMGGGNSAWFEGQIGILADVGATFLQKGDSGSLMVAAGAPGRRARPEARRPVGLLFAGNEDDGGIRSLANPIQEVLNALDVTIDGK